MGGLPTSGKAAVPLGSKLEYLPGSCRRWSCHPPRLRQSGHVDFGDGASQVECPAADLAGVIVGFDAFDGKGDNTAEIIADSDVAFAASE